MNAKKARKLSNLSNKSWNWINCDDTELYNILTEIRIAGINGDCYTVIKESDKITDKLLDLGYSLNRVEGDNVIISW